MKLDIFAALTMLSGVFSFYAMPVGFGPVFWFVTVVEVLMVALLIAREVSSSRKTEG